MERYYQTGRKDQGNLSRCTFFDVPGHRVLLCNIITMQWCWYRELWINNCARTFRTPTKLSLQKRTKPKEKKKHTLNLLALLISTLPMARVLTRSNKARKIVTFNQRRSRSVIFHSYSSRRITLSRWFTPPTVKQFNSATSMADFNMHLWWRMWLTGD